MKIGTMLGLSLAAAMIAAAPAGAQRVISPGMSPGQVRSVFGAPARTRDEGEWTYWFYANGCAVRCGSDDVVFFRGDRVVAGVMRTRARRIAAPPAAQALAAAGGSADAGAVSATAREDQEAAPAPSRAAPRRVIVRGRSHPQDEPPARAPARVGRIHVESSGRVIDRATTSTAPVDTLVPPPARSGSNDSRTRQNAPAAGAAPQATIIRRGGTMTGGATTGGMNGTATGGAATTGGAAANAIPSGGNANGVSTTGSGVITAPVQRQTGSLGDSTQTAPATAVDDKRYTRESQVRRTTVPNATDTIQAERRDRENSVTPRVVPKP